MQDERPLTNRVEYCALGFEAKKTATMAHRPAAGAANNGPFAQPQAAQIRDGHSRTARRSQKLPDLPEWFPNAARELVDVPGACSYTSHDPRITSRFEAYRCQTARNAASRLEMVRSSAPSAEPPSSIAPNAANRLKPARCFALSAEPPSGTASNAANRLKRARCFVLTVAPLRTKFVPILGRVFPPRRHPPAPMRPRGR